MRVLLTGARGQLGQHLIEHCPDDIELIASHREHEQWPCDLSDRPSVEGLLDAIQPDCIINPAAWTAVDDAEDHEDHALILNRDLPSWLAAWSRNHDAGLISYSTDYVFDGQPGRGWTEADPCRPASAYGRSKWAGEQTVLAQGTRALIVRTAWVYSALPGNFLTAILNRAVGGNSLRVVADQVGSPTWAGSLAQASWALLGSLAELASPEIVHVAGKGAMSWHEFAQRAISIAQARGWVPKSVEVEAIGSDAWPQKAKRPAWSVLDCSRFEDMTGTTLASVDIALEECLEQWAQQMTSQAKDR
ncbi:MAG: dTDP-4-dehydrorhamnose reductase [Pseudomonadota bacterium]